MLSILLPSRGRPELCKKAVDSIRETAEEEIEILLYIDEDDPRKEEYMWKPCERESVRMAIGPNIRCAKSLLKLAEFSTGDFITYSSDDYFYVTKGWDKTLKRCMPKDGIGVVYPADHKQAGKTKTMTPFISRKRYDAVGLYPDRFIHFCADTWILDIAKQLDRLFFVPEVIIEHHHPKHGYAMKDDTYHWVRNYQGTSTSQTDKWVFDSLENERKEKVEILKGLIGRS